ncbi:hypothetical protein [Microcoleus sp. D3_18a_C4]|uniref:hypothetical protein n=1 Tax=unclassified Microcoleus TaxID=2642155 RepID=UPI002FD5381D
MVKFIPYRSKGKKQENRTRSDRGIFSHIDRPADRLHKHRKQAHNGQADSYGEVLDWQREPAQTS